MATLEIMSFPDSRLRTVAKPVTAFDENLRQLVRDLRETMYAESGIGLAATQVNVHQRVLVLDVSDSRDRFHAYINPELVRTDGETTCEEGCLSVPGVFADVKRAQTVHVRAQAPDGRFFEQTLDGLHAVCLQHEMDHLRGVLFVDYLSPLKRQMVRKKLEKQKRYVDDKASVVF